jgi:pyruvate,water dikinase
MSGEILLKGIPACQGIVSGKVKVINSPNEIEKLRDGDVLVASMTNPDYTPAMLKASAIVTDIGGMLSHAAIVARELGIPSVVGTRDATKKLRDGMEVTVDGGKGIVLEGNR